MEVGVGGARDRALGLPAVKASACGAWPVLLLLPVPQRPVRRSGGIAGAVAGAATGAASMNPVVGYAVAVSVRAGTDSAMNYVMRERQDAEQTAIAGDRRTRCRRAS